VVLLSVMTVEIWQLLCCCRHWS